MSPSIPEGIRIILCCRRCKKRIVPYLEDERLQGLFLADDVVWSEVLERPVVFNGKVICIDCVMTHGC